jgi:hypothetical protein
VARILILGGGCRGLWLCEHMRADGHAARIVTRSHERRSEIEATGAECLIGDPNRLATLRAAAEHVAIACWLLASASGEDEQLRALHGPRLEQFLRSLVDSPVRGFIYEAGGCAVASDLLARGEQIVLREARRNALATRILRADPADCELWAAQAGEAIAGLLGGA